MAVVFYIINKINSFIKVNGEPKFQFKESSNFFDSKFSTIKQSLLVT